MQQTRRSFLKAAGIGLSALAIPRWLRNSAAAAAAPEARLANIVLIFMDDMGYADIGPFGAKAYPTPNIDRMAREGRIFTDFHAATAVCSASRAGLMTGCHAERVSILGALSPKANYGISDQEVTLAQICKQKGYATTCIGKWHLGHHRKFLPTRHGFDSYLGIPYSNDMTVDPTMPVADNCLFREGMTLEKMRHDKPQHGVVPLMRDEKVIEYPVDQNQLTTRYAREAVKFIQANRDRPFLLYLPHSMVHVPLHVSDKFKGKSKRGLFGDVVMEVDWSVGQVLKALKDNGLDDNTLVIFTSDNGPWLVKGRDAGSAKPLREGKMTMWEGGYREPTIMRWPGHMPAGTVCKDLASTMDILPTVARLIGVKLPDHKIDGHDIMPLITGQDGVKTPWDVMCCYYSRELRGIRDQRWKLVFPHKYYHVPVDADGVGGGRGTAMKAELALYDLQNDVSETTDVKDRHPDVVSRFQAAAEIARKDLGDRLKGLKTGSGVRPHGTMDAKT